MEKRGQRTLETWLGVLKKRTTTASFCGVKGLTHGKRNPDHKVLQKGKKRGECESQGLGKRQLVGPGVHFCHFIVAAKRGMFKKKRALPF